MSSISSLTNDVDATPRQGLATPGHPAFFLGLMLALPLAALLWWALGLLLRLI